MTLRPVAPAARRIAEGARAVAQGMVGDDVAVDTVVIDRAGTILARAG